MGPSPESSIAIVPIDLGDAAAFDFNLFPAEYYKEDSNIGKGIVLITATLKEMEKIKELGIDLNKNDDFIFSTRVELEELKEQRAKLGGNRKSFNPFKSILNYRAARLFHKGSKKLYLKTLKTSERICREEPRLRVVPRTQLQRVAGPIPPGVPACGLAVLLPDGLNEDAERTINDARQIMATTESSPFQDNSLISQLRDDEQPFTLHNKESLLSLDEGLRDESGRPTVSFSGLGVSSPTTHQTIITIHNSPVIAINSSVNGLTNNSGARDSCGATIAQGSAS